MVLIMILVVVIVPFHNLGEVIRCPIVSKPGNLLSTSHCKNAPTYFPMSPNTHLAYFSSHFLYLVGHQSQIYHHFILFSNLFLGTTSAEIIFRASYTISPQINHI